MARNLVPAVFPPFHFSLWRKLKLKRVWRDKEGERKWRVWGKKRGMCVRSDWLYPQQLDMSAMMGWNREFGFFIHAVCSFEVYIMEMGDSMCLSWCHCVIIRIDNKQLETPRCNLLCDSHSLTSSCGWPKWRGITVGTIFFFTLSLVLYQARSFARSLTPSHCIFPSLGNDKRKMRQPASLRATAL